MKKMVIALVVVVTMAASGMAIAQGWGGGRGMGMGYGPPAGAPGAGPSGPALNLSPEQTQKMQALQEKHFKETIPLRNELMAKQMELRTLWGQTTPDEAKILAKQKEINALRAQLQELGTKYRLEMRQMLTPEQQAQGNAYGGFGPGFGKRGGFGPGGGCGMGMGRGMGMGYGPCARW